jgi:hypothetical protein
MAKLGRGDWRGGSREKLFAENLAIGMIGVRRHNSKKAQASKIPFFHKFVQAKNDRETAKSDINTVHDVFVTSILRGGI